jgi:hypothetical protein
MGITIHYKGKLNNPALVYSVTDELKDISEIMKWDYTIMDEDWDEPMTAGLLHHENRVEITGHLPLKGILINLHPGCESFSVLFDKDGWLQSVLGMVANQNEKKKSGNGYLFVKTQFAPPEIHIAIIKLLKYLKNKFIPDLEVVDEGSYWETEDKELLIQKISFLNKKIDQVEELISSIREEFNQLSTDEAIKLLEKTLRNKLQED